jgi:hypothetical protein
MRGPVEKRHRAHQNAAEPRRSARTPTRSARREALGAKRSAQSAREDGLPISVGHRAVIGIALVRDTMPRSNRATGGTASN